MALLRNLKRTVDALNKENQFADFFNNFDTSLNKNDITLRVNEEAVKNSIRNLLLTNRGDRFFNPTLGGDVRAMLFENISSITSNNLKDLIETAIENYEPRAQLLDVSVVPDFDRNAYNITIVFSVINNSDPVFLELLLNRIR